MCSKEICPCVPVNVTDWKAYERAMLLGVIPPENIAPQAYVNQTERRNFYFNEKGFV